MEMHPDDDDDDDDDDIILISSTRERWERLHGIQTKYKNKLGVDKKQEEDDILVVAVPATPTRKKSMTDWRRFGGSFQTLIAVGIAFLIWIAMRRTKNLQTATEKVESQEMTNGEAEDNNSSVGNHADREDAIELSNNSAEEIQSSVPVATTTTTTTTLSSVETANRRLSNTQDTRILAEQFARDVKLVQDVLKEHSLDPSLAPQLAMSLQSSQQIIDSQRELSYKNALLDAHQRNLDRQQSQEQHQESCRSARFDPNWKEKLEALRDQCGCWNGGISRLLVEVLSIQQLAVSFMPVWQRCRNSEEQELDTAIASILKDTLTLVMAEVCDCDCDCDSSSSQFSSEHSTPTTAISPTTASFYFALLDQFVNIEQWTCYGYCAILAFATLCVAILCHQGLRIMSLPIILHHVANIAALSVFYGPQRMLSWVVGTLKKMFLVNTDGTSASMACSCLLLSLWVVFPLWSWSKTYSIHNEAVRNIGAADPVDFELVFWNERAKLKQWHREQMKLRYLLLSVYSALVFWENAIT